MLQTRFCNYNLDYQQRLGFLKVLVAACKHVRGGQEELLRKVQSLFSPAALSTMTGPRTTNPRTVPAASPGRLLKGDLNPAALLQLDDIPSWQPGFSFERLDRLILWGQMVGLITPSCRLAEWSKPLAVDGADKIPENPFRLTHAERAYFLALLAYHDHVLMHLISTVGQFEPGTRVDVRQACLHTVTALGLTLDNAAGVAIQAVRTRQAIRDVLLRVASSERHLGKTALINRNDRNSALTQMAAAPIRNHLAEYHAVCRFEQLTDLHLLSKDDPRNPPTTLDTKRVARTSWIWYTTEWLSALASLLTTIDCDVERFLLSHWAQACSLEPGCSLRPLDHLRDQLEIAELLDEALPKAKRLFGAIQVHTWAMFAALAALDRGFALEFSAIFHLLEAIRHDPRYSTFVRLSGQDTYLGRTATMINGKLADQVRKHPIRHEVQNAEIS